MKNNEQILELTAEIVVAFVGNNTVSSSDLSAIIQDTHKALVRSANLTAAAKTDPGRPAVAANKSVFDEYIICLEDGQKFKSLKRHLRAKYDLSPEEYRQKWMLPSNYPMVAPQYALRRSELAKKIGLGRSRKKKK